MFLLSFFLSFFPSFFFFTFLFLSFFLSFVLTFFFFLSSFLHSCSSLSTSTFQRCNHTPHSWSPRLIGIFQCIRIGLVLRNIIMINQNISADWCTTKPIETFSCTRLVQQVHSKAEVIHLTPGVLCFVGCSECREILTAPAIEIVQMILNSAH